MNLEWIVSYNDNNDFHLYESNFLVFHYNYILLVLSTAYSGLICNANSDADQFCFSIRNIFSSVHSKIELPFRYLHSTHHSVDT